MYMRCLCSSCWSSDDGCDRGGGGECGSSIVEGGDVICDGRQLMVLDQDFLRGPRMGSGGGGGGGGGGEMKKHVAPSMQSSLVPICSLVPTCMTALILSF